MSEIRNVGMWLATFVYMCIGMFTDIDIERVCMQVCLYECMCAHIWSPRMCFTVAYILICVESRAPLNPADLPSMGRTPQGPRRRLRRFASAITPRSTAKRTQKRRTVLSIRVPTWGFLLHGLRVYRLEPLKTTGWADIAKGGRRPGFGGPIKLMKLLAYSNSSSTASLPVDDLLIRSQGAARPSPWSTLRRVPPCRPPPS